MTRRRSTAAPKHRPGADLLREWLESAGRTQVEFARELGRTPVTVWRWLQGQSRPQGQDLADVERITGGAVPAGSWWA